MLSASSVGTGLMVRVPRLRSGRESPARGVATAIDVGVAHAAERLGDARVVG
jgi:hypothetical protein